MSVIVQSVHQKHGRFRPLKKFWKSGVRKSLSQNVEDIDWSDLQSDVVCYDCGKSAHYKSQYSAYVPSADLSVLYK